MSVRNPSRKLITPNLSKNSYSLPSWWLGTTRIGKITPVRWDDITANSHWRIRTNWRVKLAPIIFPFTHKLDGVMTTAFVPYRLMMPAGTDTYSDWENFIMGDPQDRWGSANNILPYTEIKEANKAAYTKGGLNNHLGIPPLSTATINAAANTQINVMPQIAYQMIVDEFFRNPWLQERQCGIGSTFTIDLLTRVHTTGGIFTQRYANYDADYITGVLPEAYAGSSTDVELDLDISGYVKMGLNADGTTVPAAAGAGFGGAHNTLQDDLGGVPQSLYYDSVADTAGKAILEVMELRRAQALTRFLEAENRAGEENYDDWLKVMFGHDVNFQYARPIFLGSQRQTINISEVLSTAEVTEFDSDDTLIPQGTQVGHAIGSNGGQQINFFAKEPGILMTVFVLKPMHVTYNTLERFWTKQDRTEFYNYNFEGIGDQEVYNCEVGFNAGATANNLGTYGYGGRWDEYKMKNHIVCGDYSTSGLKAWQMGRHHDTTVAPSVLSSTKIQILPSYDENLRIFADQTETFDEVWLQAYNDVSAILPMKKVDIPN